MLQWPLGCGSLAFKWNYDECCPDRINDWVHRHTDTLAHNLFHVQHPLQVNARDNNNNILQHSYTHAHALIRQHFNYTHCDYTHAWPEAWAGVDGQGNHPHGQSTNPPTHPLTHPLIRIERLLIANRLHMLLLFLLFNRKVPFTPINSSLPSLFPTSLYLADILSTSAQLKFVMSCKIS